MAIVWTEFAFDMVFCNKIHDKYCNSCLGPSPCSKNNLSETELLLLKATYFPDSHVHSCLLMILENKNNLSETKLLYNIYPNNHVHCCLLMILTNKINH